MARFVDAVGYRYLAYGLLLVLSLLIGLLAVRTLAAVLRREVCVEEG